MEGDRNDNGVVSVRTHTDTGLCEWCGNPLPPPSPKWHGKVRRFDKPSCRAAWWRKERLRLGSVAREAIEALVASLPGAKGSR